jgi:uncharacterized membrane protein YkvA (DUF1232 family)
MNKNLLNALRRITAQYGPGILDDSGRVGACLSDIAADEPRPQRTAFIKCLMNNYHRELKNTAPGGRLQCKARLVKRLRDEEGIAPGLAADTVDLLEAVLFGTVSEGTGYPSVPEEKKVSEEELAGYAKHYDHNIAYRLLKKLRKATRDKPEIVAGSVGAVVDTLGKLLSALDNPATPAPLKALIIGAIGYIILPVDLIPDAIPVVGYADDVASAVSVVLAVAAYSDFDLERLDAEIDAEG